MRDYLRENVTILCTTHGGIPATIRWRDWEKKMNILDSWIERLES